MTIRTCIIRYYDNLSDGDAEYYSYSPQLDQWFGNPAKAKKVRQYMRSLKVRKAKSGETPNSVQSVTVEDLKALHTRCMRVKSTVSARQYAIYIFTFLALLRIDEALGLQLSNIEYRDEYITLTLDNRKDEQGGSMY
jgi:hypothetical protein